MTTLLLGTVEYVLCIKSMSEAMVLQSLDRTFFIQDIYVHKYIPEIDHKLYVVAKKGVAVDPFEVFQILHY